MLTVLNKAVVESLNKVILETFKQNLFSWIVAIQVTVLYFLRNRTDKDVDPSHMEREIFCGELKHNTIEALSSLLSDIYIPILRAQNGWGQCSEEGQTTLMHSMDKFVIALNETAASMRHSRQLVSKIRNDILIDFHLIHLFYDLITYCDYSF